VMQAAQATFISSTNWTERIGPAAAIATIRKHRANDVGAHLVRMGALVQDVWRSAAAEHQLPVHVSGIEPLGHLAFEGPDRQAIRTLFTQLMLDRGFLATGAFYASFAHTPGHVEAYRAAVRESFGELAAAIRDGAVASRLNGPVAHTGFARLT
jgi:glutamate-1-semialdehyde 2,1-aminomutase